MLLGDCPWLLARPRRGAQGLVGATAEDEGALGVGLEAPIVANVQGEKGERLTDQGLGPGI